MVRSERWGVASIVYLIVAFSSGCTPHDNIVKAVENFRAETKESDSPLARSPRKNEEHSAGIKQDASEATSHGGYNGVATDVDTRIANLEARLLKLEERENWNIFLKIWENNYNDAPLEELQQYANNGYAIAQYWLGKQYLEKDLKHRAEEWLGKAASKGNSSAQFELGKIALSRGKEKEAVGWFRKAADRGNYRAMSRLGVAYANGVYGLDQIFVEAYNLLFRAAVYGKLPHAQFNLGLIYRHGIPEWIKDDVEAARWLRIAAEGGYYPQAQAILGEMYEMGQGVKRDYSEAYKWYAVAHKVYREQGKRVEGEKYRRKRDNIGTKLRDREEAQRVAHNWKPMRFRGNGSGFFVRSQEVLTNAHVVSNCEEVRIVSSDKGLLDIYYATEVKVPRKKDHDIALLTVNKRWPGLPAKLRKNPPILGEEVVAAGYPHHASFSQSGVSITQGNVSAVTGFGNDRGFFRMTAPIQRGNSGGPVVDGTGNVLGLSTLKISEVGDEIIQNLNFSVSADAVREFYKELGRRDDRMSTSMDMSQGFGADSVRAGGVYVPDRDGVEMGYKLVPLETEKGEPQNSNIEGYMLALGDDETNNIGYLQPLDRSSSFLDSAKELLFLSNEKIPVRKIPYYKKQSHIEKVKGFTVLIECWEEMPAKGR